VIAAVRPRPINVVRAAAALLAALLVAGCGYHFASSGSSLPPDAQTIYVKHFDNHTRVTGINDQFMRFLKDEIARHHRLRLVDNPGDADLELSGAVLTVIALPSAYNSVLEPTIYNQSITVSAQLKDLHTNKVIWSARSIGNAQHAPVVAQALVPSTPTFLQGNLRGADIAQMPDIQVAQTQTDAAENQSMAQIAKNLYAFMSEGF
jgi:Lipopolysaccharide-assembly